MTDLLQPPTRAASLLDLATSLDNFEPGFGQYLRAQAGEGFWASTSGQILARSGLPDPGDDRVLGQDEWRNSPFFRKGLNWDESMTGARAEAIARTFDENALRRWVIEQRNAGLGEGVAGFVAGVVGSIPAAENFIPVAGPAFRGAQALRLTARAGTAAEVAVGRFGAIGGRAALGATDAALGTALTVPFVQSSQRYFGDDVGLADALLDIAVGALAGGAIGGLHGVLVRNRVASPDTAPPRTLAEQLSVVEQQAALDAVAKGAADLAEGRSIDVGPILRSALGMGTPARRADTALGSGTLDQPGFTLRADERAAPTPTQERLDIAAREVDPVAFRGFDEFTGRVNEARAEVAAARAALNEIGYTPDIQAQIARLEDEINSPDTPRDRAQEAAVEQQALADLVDDPRVVDLTRRIEEAENRADRLEANLPQYQARIAEAYQRAGNIAAGRNRRFVIRAEAQPGAPVRYTPMEVDFTAPPAYDAPLPAPKRMKPEDEAGVKLAKPQPEPKPDQPRPEPKPADLTPEDIEFNRLLAEGRVPPEIAAEYRAATAEFERSARYTEAFDAARACAMGG